MSDSIVAAPAAEVAAPVDGAPEVEVSEDIVDDGSDLEAQPESTADIDAAQKAGDITKKEAQSLKKKLKLKVDGEEQEVEFDMNDEAALIRELQKSRSFDKRTREHSTYKSQVDQMMKMLMEDPSTVLERLGLNMDDIAEKRLSNKIDEMRKSPEQVKQEKLETELQTLRKEKKEAEEAKQRAEGEKLRDQAAAQIENDITESLESGKSFLPKKSPWVLRNVAQYMFMAHQNGYPQVTAKDVLPLVESKYKEEMAELFGVSSEEMIEQLVGKSNLDRYRKSVISKKKTTAAVPVKPKIEDTGSRKTKEEEKVASKVPFKSVFNWRT